MYCATAWQHLGLHGDKNSKQQDSKFAAAVQHFLTRYTHGESPWSLLASDTGEIAEVRRSCKSTGD
jgi:hypothetical protein